MIPVETMFVYSILAPLSTSENVDCDYTSDDSSAFYDEISEMKSEASKRLASSIEEKLKQDLNLIKSKLHVSELDLAPIDSYDDTIEIMISTNQSVDTKDIFNIFNPYFSGSEEESDTIEFDRLTNFGSRDLEPRYTTESAYVTVEVELSDNITVEHITSEV